MKSHGTITNEAKTCKVKHIVLVVIGAILCSNILLMAQRLTLAQYQYHTITTINENRPGARSVPPKPKPKITASDSIRVIALCDCTTTTRKEIDPDRAAGFDLALKRLSQLIPEIDYIGWGSDSACEDNVEQWMPTRLLQSAANTTTIIEMIYYDKSSCTAKSRSLNAEIVGLSSQRGKWSGGMHYPSYSTHFRRFVRQWGEVNHAAGISCDPLDTQTINAYRSRELWRNEKDQDNTCPVVHEPGVVYWAQHFLQTRILDSKSPKNETLLSMLAGWKSLDEARGALETKSKFCILLTMTTFQPKYATDALVRHALCRLLTKKYKPCHAVHSWKGIGAKEQNITLEKPLSSSYKPMQPYKFVITMPNRFQEGYIAEKTLHPYLADSVAVTAIPSIGKYINADRMLTCHVPKDELAKVQRYYRGNFDWMPFNTTPDMWGHNETTNGTIVKPIHIDPYAEDGKGKFSSTSK
jgi:hypothetical protein